MKETAEGFTVTKEVAEEAFQAASGKFWIPVSSEEVEPGSRIEDTSDIAQAKYEDGNPVSAGEGKSQRFLVTLSVHLADKRTKEAALWVKEPTNFVDNPQIGYCKAAKDFTPEGKDVPVIKAGDIRVRPL